MTRAKLTLITIAISILNAGCITMRPYCSLDSQTAIVSGNAYGISLTFDIDKKDAPLMCTNQVWLK